MCGLRRSVDNMSSQRVRASHPLSSMGRESFAFNQLPAVVAGSVHNAYEHAVM